MSDQCNLIPDITDPLGRAWNQPSRSEIDIDDTHALMDTIAFDDLSEYSCSIPSGVYDGKMWKAHIGGKWLLRWYGPDKKPGHCAINQREIIKEDES